MMMTFGLSWRFSHWFGRTFKWHRMESSTKLVDKIQLNCVGGLEIEVI